MTEVARSSQPVSNGLTAAASAPRLAEIYEAEFDYVWHSLRRLGVRPADLEDLAHEVFVTAWKAFATYDAARPLRPWLFGVAFRVSSDFKRRAHHQREQLGETGDAPDTPDPGASPEEALGKARDRKLVLDALEALEPNRRAVFVMHELNGFGMPEIARELEAPLNTCYSRLRLARADFAAAVKKRREAPGQASNAASGAASGAKRGGA